MFNDHGGESASSLIDRAGLKGTQIGHVEISDREPNVFITHPGATADDVIRLMELVQSQVMERLEIKLESAIQIW
jgi:UDP-N-acetylmuramate dehydrogenase